MVERCGLSSLRKKTASRNWALSFPKVRCCHARSATSSRPAKNECGQNPKCAAPNPAALRARRAMKSQTRISPAAALPATTRPKWLAEASNRICSADAWAKQTTLLGVGGVRQCSRPLVFWPCAGCQLVRFNRRHDFSAKFFQHLRLFPRAGVRPQLHAVPTRKYVEMQMEYDLAAGELIVLQDRYPVRRERRLDGNGDFLHAGDELAENRGIGVEDIARRGFGQHQHVAVRAGHYIHEGERCVVLIDLVTRQLAAQDLRENICLVIGRCRHWVAPHKSAPRTGAKGIKNPF